jgi:N utilization substance protein B
MVLYGIDLAGHDADVALFRFWASFGEDGPLDPAPAHAPEAERAAAFRIDPVEPEVRDYAETLVRGIAAERDGLDAAIQRVSRTWRIPRMALVDRNLLRLGGYELLYRSADVPRGVAINEAVELAKKFGAEEARAFVNGVLDRLGRAAG